MLAPNGIRPSYTGDPKTSTPWCERSNTLPCCRFLFQDVNKEADHHMSGQLAGLGHQVDAFDWEGDRRLQHAEEDLIVYEMHVRGFTADTSSGAEEPGTYKAVSVPQNAMLVEGFLW